MSWNLTEPQPLTSDCLVEEARMRVAQYRMMADAAKTTAVRAVLLRLARRYEEMAETEDD